MSEIDDIFGEIASSLRAEGVGAGTAQREDAPFLRDGDRIVVRLSEEVLSITVQLVAEVRELLETHDERVSVLFPDAYEDDDTQNQAWHLMQGELMRTERVERCERVIAGAVRGEFTLEEADDWLRVFNDMRLLVTGREPTEKGMKKLYRADTPAGAVFVLASAVLHALLEVA